MGSSTGCIPTRAVIALMLFTATFISYTTRVNMSINIIAMVEPTTGENGSEVAAECAAGANATRAAAGGAQRLAAAPDYGTRYDWDNAVQGLILGSYFWGFTLTCFPGGLMAERFGATRVVLVSTLLSGVLTLLGPLAASGHYHLLILTRFLLGLCGGVVYPCMHCLVSRWAPPEEKGKFIGALLGGTFGTVVTWPALGAIIEHMGWTWSFYINAAVILLWCALWVLLVSDTPQAHPRIDDDERLFIVKSLANVTRAAGSIPPYRDIVVSVPFWAMVCLHFGNLWGLFFLMTAGPKYLSTVLGFDLGHTGVMAALPYLARLVFGFLFGLVGDAIRKRGLMSTTCIRKGFVLFSHIIPGALLLLLPVVGCDVNWSVALMTMSLGANGASTLTNLQNSQDLAPNFAGSLYGIMNCVASTTGFITPTIVGYITQDNNGLHEWSIIFVLGAAVYILTGIVFCLFGSGEVQSWNAKGGAGAAAGVYNKAFAPDVVGAENGAVGGKEQF